MTFKYYIVAPNDGDIWGTNDQDAAEQFSMSDEHYVIDVENNQWVLADTIGKTFDIPEWQG